MSTTWTDEMIELERATQMPVRIYGCGPASRSAPLVLHLHGGAFVNGSLDTVGSVPKLLADAGAIVISADYPLAPEHPFPEALQAAFQALCWLHKQRARWVSRRQCTFVAGEEAGGNLAAALALMARDQQCPPLAGQILLSPMLDPRMATCSLRRAEAGPVGCMWADGWHQYLGSADKASHPYAAPLGSSRLRGLPPALVLTAEDDPMQDESLSYAQRLQDAGVTVRREVLAAPTGWPCSLLRPERGEIAWAVTVRERFKEFFAQTLSWLRPIPPRPLQA